MINSSKKPVLYVGGGIINSNASEVLIELAKKNSIPVASTLMGLGCLPPEDPLNLGLIGMHGERSTNYILDEADLLLAFGVRFDDRAIGNASKFCKRASIIHIDIDPAEINKIKKASLSIIGDAQEILKKLIPLVESDKRELWVKKVNSIKRAYPPYEPNPEDIFHPINFIKKIGKMAKANTVVTTDVGQHQMWVAKSYPFSSPKTLLTSGGLGTMGFGLPSAIGAALANPDGQVICFSGDGSFLMNLQELATLSDLKLNVKIFILNNGHLGLVRQLQEMFYSKNYIACKFDTNPNFAVISQGFGIKGYDLNEEENPDEILNKILTEPGPCVVNVHVPFTENVLPIVPPGAPNYEMLGGDIND